MGTPIHFQPNTIELNTRKSWNEWPKNAWTFRFFQRGLFILFDHMFRKCFYLIYHQQLKKSVQFVIVIWLSPCQNNSFDRRRRWRRSHKAKHKLFAPHSLYNTMSWCSNEIIKFSVAKAEIKMAINEFVMQTQANDRLTIKINIKNCVLFECESNHRLPLLSEINWLSFFILFKLLVSTISPVNRWQMMNAMCLCGRFGRCRCDFMLYGFFKWNEWFFDIKKKCGKRWIGTWSFLLEFSGEKSVTCSRVCCSFKLVICISRTKD